MKELLVMLICFAICFLIGMGLVLWFLWWISGQVLRGFAIGVVLLGMGACASRQSHASVPGCNAPVDVPQGCYSRLVGDRLEVRCPDHTWKYRCTEGSK